MADPTVTPPEVLKLPPITNPLPQVHDKPIRKCPSCGGTDHFRRSSKKCLHYVPRASVVKDNNKKQGDEVEVSVVIEDTNQQQTTTTVDSSSIINSNSNSNNNNNVTNVSKNIDSTSNADDIDISTPEFIKLNSTTDVAYKPVVDVASKDFQIQETVFKVFEADHRGRKFEVSASPDNLMKQYFTPEFIYQFVSSSNKYRQNRMKQEPDLYCWKEKKMSSPISESNIYQFLAILYYFGLVVLPSKSDYWSTREWMPHHPIVHEHGFTRARFEFIWRHFHPSYDETELDDPETTLDEEDNAEDERVNVGLERIQRDQDEIADDDEEVEDTTRQSSKKVWYTKLTGIIDHVRTVSKEFVYVLGTILSLDEMMIRFFGRSSETHRMKNKPIKEGYKFFVLTTKEGFILNFTPDGRKAARVGEQEYEEDKKMGKVESMILFMLKIIEELKQKQLTRLQNKKKVATRSNTTELFNEEMMSKFCLAMDNYFTLPKVIVALRNMGIGIVGTARYRGSWPPKELKNVSKESAKFNEFYWTIDEFGTLVARWMDNGMVFCVSTMHKVGNRVKRMRKRPRKTANNKNHIEKIWGEKGATDIYIPTLIDDYNYWMGGVDVADQRISYYHPSKLVCRRTWIPIFMQLLSIIRNNAYLVHRTNCKKPLSQKQFLHHMVCWLMSMSRATSTQQSSSRSSPSSSATKKAAKKRRTSPSAVSAVSNLTERFPNRYALPKQTHARTNGQRRGRCVFCSALWKDKKKNNEKVGDIRKESKRTWLHCQHCSLNSPTDEFCFLCKEHFDVYHAF